MNRQNIVIDGHKYILDLYKHNVDLKENHYEQYVMLRRFDIMNNVVYDTDIYFIERSIIEDYIEKEEIYYSDYASDEEKNEFEKIINSIVYPIHNTKSTGFSSKRTDFNDNYNFENFKLGYDIYEIYGDDKGYTIGDIPCDLIKLYHPSSFPNIRALIYVDNYLNNIHFHYLCRPVSYYEIKSEESFKVDNNYYSEYINVWIPNLEELFKKKKSKIIKGNKTDNYKEIIEEDCFYFKENLNILSVVDVKENENYFDNVSKNKEFEYMPLSLLLEPFMILKLNDEEKEKYKITDNLFDDNDDYYKKVYVEISKSIENNYLTYPINFTIWPYTNINENNGLYIVSDYLNYNKEVFVTNCRFELSGKLSFDDNGIISYKTEFLYPYKSLYINKYGSEEKALEEAYKFYYNVRKEDYLGWAIKNDEINEDEINDEEIVEDYKKINCIGFSIVISSDMNFKNIIYNNYIELKVEESNYFVSDFAFNLDEIFKSWDQMPELMIIQTKFIDKYLGNILTSNFSIINKEWFKYMINDTDLHILNISNKQNNLIENMDLYNNFNFIDKINCNVIQQSNDSENIIINRTNSPKVIYKPIFFKVNDIQDISLVKSITQNIGINLSDYMTKVETFRIIIDGQTFNETGRTDIYVIFEINPINIENESGIYYLINQDNEYINYGNYTLLN